MPISNITQFTRKIRQIQRSVTNLRPFFRDVAAPATHAEIRRLITRQGIIKTGRYLRAATEPTHAGHLMRVSDTELEIGVNLRWFERNARAGYPLFLELGTRRMRARPVYSAIAGSEVYERRIIELYEKWSQQQIDKVDQ